MKVKDLIFFNIIVLLIFFIGIVIIDRDIKTYQILLGLLSTFAIIVNGYLLYIKDKEEYKSDGAKFLHVNVNNNIFKNDNDFIDYIYNNYCQCKNQCIGMPSNSVDKQDGYCSEIVPNNDITNILKYNNLISNAISYLINKGLLIRSGVRFYIIDNNFKLKLTWGNIKSLKNENNQKIFWLFRKLIVDAILKRILLKKFNNNKSICQIFSVGSTKITSDYDITLYGSDDNKVIVINEFQKFFKQFFSEDSSIVFDTNVYGKSYIYFSNDSKFNNILLNHNNNQFYYLKPYFNENIKLINLNSQLIWGIIKFLKDLSEEFDEKIYNDLVEFYTNKLNYRLFNIAQETLTFLINQDNDKINYSSIMLLSNKIENIYSEKLNSIGISNEDCNIIKEHELVALTNFYGTETYYTRGAFLDTVVNQQMLMGKDKLQLLDIELVTSILENAGFFLVHNTKSKYIIRVRNTLTELIKYPNYFVLQNDLNKLNNVIYQFAKGNDFDSGYCKWVSDNDNELNLLKCEKYTIFNVIFNLIFNILKLSKNIYNNDKTSNLPFYDYFVKESNEIFQLTKSINSFSILKKIDSIKSKIN